MQRYAFPSKHRITILRIFLPIFSNLMEESKIKKSQEPMLTNESHMEVVAKDSVKQVAVKDSLSKAKAEKPAIHKTFENVAFDKMIAEIAAYYDG